MSTENNNDLDVPTFEYPEEPLALPADEGYGFFQGGPGDSLGPSGRYLLQAKLGYGVGSNVWLAKDNKQECYVSLKILSGYNTQLNKESKLRELVVLQKLSALSEEKKNHCTQLLDHFYHRGVEQDGEHLCLVLRLEQASLSATQAKWSPSEGLPVPIVKRIIRHVLHGLSGLHACGIAHTDLKPDNIMIGMSPQLTTKALENWVAVHPARVYPPMQSLYKMVTNGFMSETLPLPSIDDLAQCTFRLTDVGHSQIVDDQTTDDITPLTLRPPEVILGGQWTESVDIWTLGALGFTLMTGKPLFSTSVLDRHKCFLREGIADIHTSDQKMEALFWQMAAFTGKRYPPAVLELYPLSWNFFMRDGMLKSFNAFILHPIEQCMRDAGFGGSESDVAGACALIRRCLHIDPMARPSAQDLLDDPWLQS